MKNDIKIIGDIAIILLKRKDGSILEAIIDSDDVEKVERFPNTWYASKNKMGTFYAFGEISKGTRSKGTFKKITYPLHRWIIDPPNNMVVDHIDHNTLNNRKSNLRILTVAENNQNKKINHIPGIYPYYYNKEKWIAYGTSNRTVNLGIFNNIKDAEKAVIEFKRKHHKYSKVVSNNDVS